MFITINFLSNCSFPFFYGLDEKSHNVHFLHYSKSPWSKCAITFVRYILSSIDGIMFVEFREHSSLHRNVLAQGEVTFTFKPQNTGWKRVLSFFDICSFCICGFKMDNNCKTCWWPKLANIGDEESHFFLKLFFCSIRISTTIYDRLITIALFDYDSWHILTYN